jgi:hypothetical protein
MTSAPISSFAASIVSNSGNVIGDTPIPGEAMLPRNRVRTSWNGTGHR